MRKSIALLIPFSILILFSNALGQWTRKQTTAKRITETIVIDIVIDDAAWKGAPEVSNFIQFQPPFGFVQLAYQRGTGKFGEKGTRCFLR